ncbi:hypothetical protein C7B77_11320 [Chamaesiphon polymorphus CCALA 037]|uniref:Uncharacterized protein n=1 Tax=Chamaesiphon polymorphus CCALA 037 TaxID=2107692 RepID=A0A2T1GG66_9CYAN|nr:hypothetical protein C7B77_11320 [Chamaesiphon polymorphus CCALA 037]
MQCLYKDDTLWVLAQHPADVVIDIPDTFSVLERALQAEEPKTPLSVKLYLRAEGNQRPYSQQGFTVYPLVKKTVPGEAAPEMTGTGEDRNSFGHERDRGLYPHSDLSPGKPLDISDNRMENSEHIPSTVPEVVSDDNALVVPGARQPRASRIVKIDTDKFVANIEHSFGATTDADYQTVYPASKRRGKLVPILGGLGLLAIGSGAAYMGTRPCVLSVCTALNTATQLKQSSLATIKNPAVTGQEVLTAQKQLRQSVVLLESIPMWSGNYSTAQTSLQQTTPLVADLDTTVEGMNKAFQAANLVKTQPIPLATWQQSKQLWTQSISSLGRVSPNSQIYPLTRQKLTDYQSRLADIDRRIEAETSADRNLKSATEGIKAAKQAQASAVSLAQWRSVKTLWDNANSQLTSIPPTTTVYPQAQEIIKAYQSQFTTAQDKVIEEEKAAQNYNKAIKFAQAAKLSQKNNKLAQSASEWSQSVAAIQSIPQTSSAYTQAQPLIYEYTKSFQQVQSQVKAIESRELANKDLQKTCTGEPQICSFTVSNKAIVVRLTPLYTQTLMQTAAAATSQGDGNAKVGILKHVQTLGNALQAIGDNAKLPIEIYGADGKQIQSYKP